MACPGCPESVTQTLRSKVQAELDKLMAILNMSDVFSASIGAASPGAFASIDSAVDAIPNPIGITGFLDLVQYVTCPLTPLALGLSGVTDLLDTDPNTQIKKLKGLVSGEIDAARRTYETTLNADPSGKIVSQLRKYEQQLRNIQFDPESFAEAVLISASIFVFCDATEFTEGPFNSFAVAAQGFSFTGGVPSTLDSNLAAGLSKLVEGEGKFGLLRAALY